MEQIRLMIVEDDPEWLRGLTSYLDGFADLKVVTTASSSQDAMIALVEADVDVVLMDIILTGDVAGIWLTAHITSSSTARVIMLTSLEDKEMMLEAFRAGAVDYHIKSDYTGIPDAVRSAYERRSPISPAAAEQMRTELRRLLQLEREAQLKEMRALLTPTELEVLKLIDQGMTQPQIADSFYISLRTVKNHVGHIIRKLGAASSREAAEKARKGGLFTDRNTKYDK